MFLCSKRFNSISGFHDSSLAGLKKVELLMLHSNDLHHLPDGAFRDMKSLQVNRKRMHWIHQYYTIGMQREGVPYKMKLKDNCLVGQVTKWCIDNIWSADYPADACADSVLMLIYYSRPVYQTANDGQHWKCPELSFAKLNYQCWIINHVAVNGDSKPVFPHIFNLWVFGDEGFCRTQMWNQTWSNSSRTSL